MQHHSGENRSRHNRILQHRNGENRSRHNRILQHHNGENRSRHTRILQHHNDKNRTAVLIVGIRVFYSIIMMKKMKRTPQL